MRLERGSVGFPPRRGFFIWCKRGIERLLKGPGHERTMKIERSETISWHYR